jgi:polar amino acid transport system substrate-binding protein
MIRNASLMMAALFAGLLFTTAGRAAESVLDRVEKTGVLKAGTRETARPFAFRDASGKLAGFSVDLLSYIRESLERELNRPVKLDLSVVTADTRIDRVEDGSLDITCDIASKTWVRDRRIDFSLTFFFNGTRILTSRDIGLRGMDGLSGHKVGVVTNSSTIRVVERAAPNATIVQFPDMGQAMKAMEAGEVDGVSNISIVLRDLQRKAANPGQWLIIPRTGYLNREPMACILPNNDSRWRDFVDHTIVRMLSGIEDYRGVYYDTYQRWFGPNGELHYPLSREAIAHFNEIRSWIDD